MQTRGSLNPAKGVEVPKKRKRRSAEEVRRDKEEKELARKNAKMVKAEIKKANDERDAEIKGLEKEARARKKRENEKEKRRKKRDEELTEAKLLELQAMVAQMENEMAKADRERRIARVRNPDDPTPRPLKRCDAVADLRDLMQVDMSALDPEMMAMPGKVKVKAKVKAKAKTEGKGKAKAALDESSDVDTNSLHSSELSGYPTGLESESDASHAKKKSKTSKQPKPSFHQLVEIQWKEQARKQSEASTSKTVDGTSVYGADRDDLKATSTTLSSSDSLGTYHDGNDMKAKLDTLSRKWGASGQSINSPLMSTVKCPTGSLPNAGWLGPNTAGVAYGSTHTFGCVPSSTSNVGDDQSESESEDDHAEREAALTSPVKTPAARVIQQGTVAIINKVRLAPETKSSKNDSVLVTPMPIKPRKRTTNAMPAAMVEKKGGNDAGKVGKAQKKGKSDKPKKAANLVVKKEVPDNIIVPPEVANEVIEIDDSDSDQAPSHTQTESETDAAPRKKSRVKNNELLYGIATDPRWLQAYIPNIFRYLAMLENPWSCPDAKLIPVMQSCYNAVFRESHSPHKIIARNAVYARTVQKIYEWRAGFGSTAILVVERIFRANPVKYETYEARAAFARHMLDNFRFAYADARALNSSHWDGYLCSPLIEQTLAYHFGYFKSAPELQFPELLDSENNLKMPIGVIGLAAAALERILCKWKTHAAGVSKHGSKVIIFAGPRTDRNAEIDDVYTDAEEDDKGTGVKFCASEHSQNTKSWAIGAHRRGPENMAPVIQGSMKIAELTVHRVAPLAGYDSDNDLRARLGGPPRPRI